MNIEEAVHKYLVWLKQQGRPASSIKFQAYELNHFTRYLKEKGLTLLEKLIPQVIEDFQEDLAFRVTAKGRFWLITTRNKVLATLKSFLKWLEKQDYLVRDLSEVIVYAKVPKRLPRNILTVQEMEQLLEAPDITTIKGYRDRTILELLYATGIRRSELINLKLEDFDLENGTLHIREGKGNKDRVVPLGKGLCELLKHYQAFVREKLLTSFSDASAFFLGRRGRLSDTYLRMMLLFYKEKIGIEKRVYPHAFRHACATHMLNNGAPIRCVQELLGHERVDTTMVYTHVTINDLKKAHKKYHPRERQKRSQPQSCRLQSN